MGNQNHAHHHAAQPKHRPQAQVDALGQDDERHAERNDDQRRALQRDVREIARRKEFRTRQREARREQRQQIGSARQLGHACERRAQRARSGNHCEVLLLTCMMTDEPREDKDADAKAQAEIRRQPEEGKPVQARLPQLLRRPRPRPAPGHRRRLHGRGAQGVRPGAEGRRRHAPAPHRLPVQLHDQGLVPRRDRRPGRPALRGRRHLAPAARDQAQLPRVLARLRNPRDLLTGGFRDHRSCLSLVAPAQAGPHFVVDLRA